MVKKQLYILLIPLILTGCSSPSLQGTLQAIVDGDRAHSQEQEKVQMTTLDLTKRISAWWHLDLSNLELWSIPDLCGLLNSVDLGRIVSLDLSNNKIQQVSGLDCLPSLKDLNLSNNDIDTLLWFPLMQNLEKLNIARNNLRNLKWVELLQWVIELQLGENYLEDLVWIENLANLEKLWVQFNKLKDLDVLKYVDTLKDVDATYNELKEKAEWLMDLIPWLSI